MSASGGHSYKSSDSSQQSDQRVWAEQSPYLQDLYAQSQGQLAPSQGYADQAATAYSDTAPSFGQNYQDARQSFSDTLGQNNVYGQTGQAAANSLQGFMSGDPVDNPYLQANVERALEGVSTNLQRNILPSIGGDAAQAGQYGSSRHGIAEGLALSDANAQATNLAGQMYGQAYDQGMQNRLNATQQAGQLMGAGVQAGLAEQQGYQNLANLGMLEGGAYSQAGQAGYLPLNNYAQLIGGPTTLGSSSGTSKSHGYSMQLGGGFK